MSRDLDSRISPREVAAVEDFYSPAHANASAHFMRDHPAHNAYIMGGMWGMKIPPVREAVYTAFKKLLKDPVSYGTRSKGGYDQVALGSWIYPWAKWKALSHDSYLCMKYPRTSPWPTRRPQGPGNYVGSIHSLEGSLPMTPEYECPERCRPQEHRKDWLYC